MDPMISLGQKNTLAEYMILSGVDNRPPMLEKDLAGPLSSSGLLAAYLFTCDPFTELLKDLWKRVSHIKGESLHTYYLRFTQLINDMNIYKMKMEQFPVNTKFLNSPPPEME
ncbi:hypothetical protein Tco_0707155 [Tanacetum coccineum]|uniref:Retrotransposon gag domain-containing protein n=1 Tax=Tanacetum coccineum TaxID=301880 RepID=A0ABQ4Y9E5_9ASTR